MVQLLELTKTLSSFQALLQEHVPSELQAVPHFACRKPVGGHTLQALALRMMRKLVDPDGVTCRMDMSFGLYCLSNMARVVSGLGGKCCGTSDTSKGVAKMHVYPAAVVLACSTVV